MCSLELLTNRSYKPALMGSSPNDGDGNGTGTAVITKSRTKLSEPSMYRVLLHNDDFTPMDFVVQVLQVFFHKDVAQANKIMLEVHEKGIGLCGVYPRELAETKAVLVSEKARENQYPLRCTFEEDI